MRARFTLTAGVALLATGVAFTAAFARNARSAASAGQRSVAPAPQKLAATSMVVYKSPT